MDGLLLEVVILISCLILGYIWWKLSKGPGAHVPRGTNLPPVEGGWLPWIGCAVEFGKAPLWYIKKAQRKHGDIFTVHAAGKWMTFIMDANFYHHFFSSNSIDFMAAIQPICHAVSDVLPSTKDHNSIGPHLKGRLTSNTGVLCPILSDQFHTFLTSYGEEGDKDLFDFVRDAMFSVVVRELYGKENMPTDKEYIHHLLNEFVKYDEGFEYGADLPEIFMKDWHATKRKLLKTLKVMMDIAKTRMGGKSYQVYDILFSVMENKDNFHNYALLLLWGSQGNSIPVVFWTLCHILSDPEIYKRVRDEVKDVSFPSRDKGDASGTKYQFEEKDLKKLVFTKRCVLEGVRLYCPGIVVRKVVKTHIIDKYTVPAGHLVILSPFWSHRNEKYFPQPDLFHPARWEESDVDKNKFLEGFVGFGGGRYQCPGKWFALMEMHLFVAMVIKMFDMTLVDPVPQPSPLHLIGSPHPSTKCRVHYTRRA